MNRREQMDRLQKQRRLEGWLLLVILALGVLALVSCAHLPCGSERQVQKWEKKTKMRAAIKKLNTDSCVIARKMAMARKY